MSEIRQRLKQERLWLIDFRRKIEVLVGQRLERLDVLENQLEKDGSITEVINPKTGMVEAEVIISKKGKPSDG